MGFLLDSYVISMGFPLCFFEFLWDFKGISTGFSLVSCGIFMIFLLPLGLSRINRPEVVSHLRARSVSYRF